MIAPTLKSVDFLKKKNELCDELSLTVLPFIYILEGQYMWQSGHDV